MNGTLKNFLLLAAVVLLTLMPLLLVNAPASGSDAQATGVIQTLAPAYQPWFDSLFKPPSTEIESLLFALQAALGAGAIGYYAGYVRGRKKAAAPSPESSNRAH